MLTVVIATAIALGAAAAASFAGPEGFGVAHETNLYRIDLATGTATLVGSTGSGSIYGLTFSADGTLYGVDSSTDNAALVTIDTSTGAATPVGPTGVVDLGHPPTGLTFTSDGRLLMAHQSNIYELSTTTGLATVVGSTGVGSLDALATDCAGTVYSMKAGGNPAGTQLFTVNTSTGAATLVGSLSPTIPTGGSPAGLDFDRATGVLWRIGPDGVPPAGPSPVTSIDVVARTDQPVSSVLALDISGLAINSSCPTPASVPITAAFTG